MGRGNVCPSGEYEGAYFVPFEYIHVYRKADKNDPFGEAEPTTSLLQDLGGDDLVSGEWYFDEVGSANEEEDVLECFMAAFGDKFQSFEQVHESLWLTSSRRALLESPLFYIAVEDNEWALAIELLQKDGGERSLSGLQGRHYERYLDGIKRALLERVPSIGFRTGPWTSGRLTKEDLT